jgi:hypothetical protein
VSDRSRTGRFIAWRVIIARLQQKPMSWERTFPDAPAKRAESVRLRRHPDLVREDGRLEALKLNQYADDEGRERADVWLRWVPSSADTVGLDGPTMEGSER